MESITCQEATLKKVWNQRRKRSMDNILVPIDQNDEKITLRKQSAGVTHTRCDTKKDTNRL